jgi:inner membrane protein
MLHPDLGTVDAIGLRVFGAVVTGVTVLSHIGADALTPMGVEPLGDDGPHISYDVCRADSTLGNYGLLALGAGGAAVAYGIGAGVNTALPV